MAGSNVRPYTRDEPMLATISAEAKTQAIHVISPLSKKAATRATLLVSNASHVVWAWDGLF